MHVNSRAAKVVKQLLAIAWAAFILFMASCDRNNETERTARSMTGGEPGRGRAAITRYGCSACHTIPGIKGATALVGPPLDRIASRSYIAGVMPNSPENMIRWIENPPGIDRMTAMPNLGVNDQDARDIASYLYTLK
jgi:cytochrome c2